jgi:hypothetical protein
MHQTSHQAKAQAEVLLTVTPLRPVPTPCSAQGAQPLAALWGQCWVLLAALWGQLQVRPLYTFVRNIPYGTPLLCMSTCKVVALWGLSLVPCRHSFRSGFCSDTFKCCRLGTTSMWYASDPG